MALSKEQIERLWVQQGGSRKAASTAAAIALAESGGKRDAENRNTNGSIDRGLFQVNSIHGDLSTKDLKANVRAAIRISGNGKNWKPWVTYNTGAYKKYASGGRTHIPASGAGQSDTAGPSTRRIPGIDNSAARAGVQSQLGANARQFLATPNGAPGSDMLDFAMQQGALQKQMGSLTDSPSRTVQVPGSSVAGTSGGSGSAGTYTDRANALDAQRLPYKWGGGHGSKAVNPYKAVPVDCSGAVSSILGIDPRVSGAFAKFGKPGRAPGGKGVTIYANSGHVLMEINGHFFGTSKSNPGGGAGWIKQEDISPSYLKGFTARHTDA